VVGLYGTFERDDRDHKKYPARENLIEEYSAAEIGRGVYGMVRESEDLGCVNHEKLHNQVNLCPWICRQRVVASTRLRRGRVRAFFAKRKPAYHPL